MPSDFWWKKKRVLSLWVITFNPLKKEKKKLSMEKKLRFERWKISSEIKGNFKLNGNVLEIALQKYSALRFERLKIIYTFKNQGK